MEKYILDSFKEKYGNNAFNQIKDTIENEVENSKYSHIIDENYILYIFEIAILQICDVENIKIASIIKRMGNNYVPPINIETLQSIHNKSINLIQGYL